MLSQMRPESKGLGELLVTQDTLVHSEHERSLQCLHREVLVQIFVARCGALWTLQFWRLNTSGIKYATIRRRQVWALLK